jgi:lanthanide-dependent methanol dehydrogenase
MDKYRKLLRRSRTFKAALLAGVASVAITGPALSQSGPSPQAFLQAPEQTENWILPAGNYTGNRQIKESEISPQNVDQMKVAWTFKIPTEGPVETSPIVWNGMVYLTSNKDDMRSTPKPASSNGNIIRSRSSWWDFRAIAGSRCSTAKSSSP